MPHRFVELHLMWYGGEKQLMKKLGEESIMRSFFSPAPAPEHYVLDLTCPPAVAAYYG